MLVKVTFKTPDVIDGVFDDIVDEEEMMDAKKFIREYIKYDEYVTLLFNTKTRTVTVERLK